MLDASMLGRMIDLALQIGSKRERGFTQGASAAEEDSVGRRVQPLYNHARRSADRLRPKVPKTSCVGRHNLIATLPIQ